MSLSDLASIAGVLSSLAVCGSLLYLALQVRLTDRNQRTLLQQGASARNMESVWKFSEPHNADVVARVWNGETDFTSAQALQLAYLIRASLLGFQDQFLLNKLSLVHSTQNETQERAIKRIFGARAFRALWNMSRNGYAPEFTSYIDGLLRDVPLAAPQDFGAQIKAAAADLGPGTER
jgi:hypothetical protein